MTDPDSNDQKGFIKWDMKKKKYVMADADEDQSHYQRLVNQLSCRVYKGHQLMPPGHREPLRVYNRQHKITQPPKQHLKQKENVERPPWNNDFVPESEPETKKEPDTTDGAGTQDTDNVKQITSGHQNMTVILAHRLIQVKAAQTFWQKSPNSLISYLLRTNDDATTVDVLPLLSSNIRNKTAKGRELTMGACLDLLPALQRILASKYEDYIVASLDMILGILRNWWKELVALGENPLNSRGLQCSRSTSGIYTSIVSMTDDINKLRKRDGKIGSKAKVIGDLLQKL